MVQAATGDAARPAAARTNGRKSALRALPSEPAEAQAIPLDLSELLAPYKRRGRLTLRIERMPVLSRLSRGRNNGDNSWSLGLDELEDLEFLAPEGANETYMLAVRIIACGAGDASTLALLDFPVICGTAFSDLTEAEALPAARESKRAVPRQKSSTGQRDTAAKSASELEAERAIRNAQEEARIAALELRASEQLEDARKAWLRESKSELAKAETAWKAAEAERFAGAEARWAEKTANEMAEAAATALDARKRRERELRQLREQLADVEAALAGREKELIAARSKTMEAAARSLEEKAAALSQAEKAWKAGEALRMAECKARWQKDADETLAAIVKRCKTAETALAEMASRQVRHEAEEAADGNRERDAVRSLSDELAAVRTSLAVRDEEISQLRAANAEMLERSGREASDAEARAANTLDEARARYEAAEQALEEMRTSANSARDKSDPARRRLHEEVANLQAVLADREVEVARLRTEIERIRAHQRYEASEGYRGDAERGNPDEGASGRRGLLRDVVLVVAVVMSAIAFYPFLEAQVRGYWAAESPAGTAVSSRPKQPAAPPAAERLATVAVRSVNIRSGPSATAAIVSTLGRGAKVAVIEERDKWTLVGLPHEEGPNRPERGWIYGSYLKAADAENEIPEAGKHS